MYSFSQGTTSIYDKYNVYTTNVIQHVFTSKIIINAQF